MAISGFYGCGKDITTDNANTLATIGEEYKDSDYGISVLRGGAKSYEDFKSNVGILDDLWFV